MLSSKLRVNSITSGFLVLPLLNSRQAENKFSTETICSKILPSKPPPNETFVAPIIFHIQSLYKEIYLIGTRIPKRDKLGLHAKAECVCIEMLILSIRASLESDSYKKDTIKKLRINIETLKHLVRTELEINIIKETQYLNLQEKLQEISKEAVGWEKYANKNSP